MNSSLVTPAEEAARRSRRGYEYQDLVAASFCLQMLRDKSLRTVACETQDDVVLTWEGTNGGSFEEFVQVKSDRQKRQWSVAMFCAQEKEPPPKNGIKEPIRYRKGTSIFEKNALRDHGNHNSRFRIVTRADVNELRVLTEPTAARSAGDITGLAKSLEAHLAGNTTLTSADINYWVAVATWDVRGTDSAVFDENFRRLAEAVQEQEQRLLSVVDLERILHHLAEETRAMAMGKGRCGANPSAVTSEELRAWLTAEVQAVPRFLGAAEVDALLREERHSLARCESLWVALGVSDPEAAALARQPHIGARADFFAGLKAGFHWVTAGYGAGKSLAVERAFQQQVADYASRRDSRVPIFFRAPGIVGGTLRDAVLSRLAELHRDAGAPPLFVVLDAVDEAGVGHAHRFLLEAYELSKTWTDSIFIATSATLPFSFEQFRTALPPLTDEQATEIVSYFARFKVQPWQVRERLSDDHGLALMCVLLGQALHETADAAPSRGELLHNVVEAARKRSGTDARGWAEQTDMLCRIAMISTDTNGGPVRPSELGLTSIETTPLATTKLVAEESGNLVFTVATMRLWFAAQTLRKGWVDETKLVGDLPRIRHWQEPLAIFIATSDFDTAARYFEPLAVTHPAIAAQVIANSTRQWGEGSGRSPSEFDAFAKRMHRCLGAWLRGISPLANVCGFTDKHGDLLKVRTGYSAPHTIISFSRDPFLPAASALPSEWRSEDAEQFHIYKEPDEPSHLWRQTHLMVRSELFKFVESQRWQLVDPALFHEEVWNQAVGLAQVSRWHASSVPWDVIERFERVFRQLDAWDWLCEKRAANPDALPSPHPPADVADRTISWIPSFFSGAAALARAQSIYGMAHAAYQRIVTLYFPNFRNDLRHSAWWPCRLVGKVGGIEGNAMKGSWWISYHCEPVESENEAVVTLELGTDEYYAMRGDFEVLRNAVMRLRPHAPSLFWAQSSVLNLHDSHPATRLVQDWLLSDLRNAGWGP
jgi:hypothetical protein